MAVKGIFVSDAGALQERDTGLNSTILRRQRGGSVPFFALSSGMKSENATAAVVTWHEEGLKTSRFVVVAVPDPVGNVLIVEDASAILENTVFMIEATGEYVMTLAVAGNMLTVQRNIGGSGLFPIVVGGPEVGMQRIGTSFEEGSERPGAVASNPFPRTNQCQIFRNAWDITGTAMATQYRFGSRLSRNKSEAAMCHAEDIERSLLWGRSHIGVVNNKPQRLMDGVIAQLRTNFFASPAGGLTRRSLTDYVERLFSVNIQGASNERITFCGNVAARALEEIIRRYSVYHVELPDNEWGLRVMRYVTPFGNLTLLIHPMFNESPVWSQQLISLHPAAMTMVWLRRTFEQDGDEQGKASNLRDATSGVFTSELTVKYGVEQTGAVMEDVTVDHYVV